MECRRRSSALFHGPSAGPLWSVTSSRDRSAVGLASNKDLAKSTLELPWDVVVCALARERLLVVAAYVAYAEKLA